MKKSQGGILAVMAAVLLLLTPLVDPWITVGLCVVVFLALAIYGVRRYVRVVTKMEERRSQMARHMRPGK